MLFFAGLLAADTGPEGVTRCYNSVQTAAGTVSSCLNQAPSYYRLKGSVVFPNLAGAAAIVLFSQDTAIQLQIQIQIASSILLFSIFAAGTSLRLENVSISVATSGAMQIKGMIPYSGATSVRNGRFEVANTQGAGCGVAGKLRGPVLLDSVYVGLEARGGAAVAFQAVSAQFKMIHCLFREALQQGGVVLGTIASVTVQAWVDSRYETTESQNDKFGDLIGLTVSDKCAANIYIPAEYALGSGMIPCSPSCENMKVTLSNFQLSQAAKALFSDVATYRFIAIQGRILPTATGVSLVSINQGTTFHCIRLQLSVGASGSLPQYSLLLQFAPQKVQVRDLSVDVSELTGTFSAFKTVSGGLELDGAQVKCTNCAFNGSSLLVKDALGSQTLLQIFRVILEASNAVLFHESALVITATTAPVNLDDVTMDFTQGPPTTHKDSGGLIRVQNAPSCIITRVIANFVFADIELIGFLVFDSATSSTITSVNIVVTQTKKGDVVASLMRYMQGSLKNLTGQFSYNGDLRIGNSLSASISYASLQAEVINATIKGDPTAAAKENAMGLINDMWADILISDVVILDFKHHTSGCAAIFVRHVYRGSKLQCKNIAVNNFLLIAQESFGVLIEKFNVGIDCLLYNVNATGRIEKTPKWDVATCMILGWTLNNIVATLTIQNCNINVVATGDHFEAMFGHYGASSRITIYVIGTAIATNLNNLPCISKGNPSTTVSIQPSGGSRYTCV